jgi:hypothetical protein
MTVSGLASRIGWPTKDQSLLLKAALLEGPGAREAWTLWKRANDIQDLDAGSFFLLPQVFRNLSLQGVTDPALAPLRGVYRYTWAKNQLILHGLMEALRCLRAAGVRSILLKGCSMLVEHCRDVGTRPMQDMDILIREKDAPAAFTALEQAGWKHPTRRPSDSLLPFLDATALSHGLYPELDIHWQLFPYHISRQAEEAIWARAPQRTYQGESVTALESTDLFVTLCASGRKLDPGTRCKWILDALELSRSGSIDWTQVLPRARSCGALLPVRDCILYLHQVLKAPIPGPVIEEATGLIPTVEDRRRYWWLLTTNSSGSQILNRFLRYRRGYYETARFRGLPTSTRGFLRHVLSRFQLLLGAVHWWQIPHRIAGRVLDRLLDRTPRYSARRVGKPQITGPSS